ncbi:MAG: hypothetical protein AAF485_05765, partial [Chloroflexota bacterium]
MPDPRPNDEYRRNVSRIEQQFSGDVREAYEAARLRLADLMQRYDPSNPKIDAGIRAEMTQLRSAIVELAEALGPGLDDLTRNATQAQLSLVQRFRPAPNVDDLDASRGLEIIQRLADNAANPVNLIEANLLSELNRLRAAVEEKQAIIDRLLAADIADGRASVARHGVNTLIREIETDLWTAANAVLGGNFAEAQQQANEVWYKQAIAGIDERTTDCCLRV